MDVVLFVKISIHLANEVLNRTRWSELQAPVVDMMQKEAG
jgi:hypothetical protein